MKLIFLRHGKAISKRPGKGEMYDFNRTLTSAGIRETKLNVKSCKDILKKIITIYTSPLLRAVETAEILYKNSVSENFEILPELDKLSDHSNVLRLISSLKQDQTYCFVGHEPQLSEVIRALTHGSIRLDKSGICVIENNVLTNLISPKMF